MNLTFKNKIPFSKSSLTYTDIQIGTYNFLAGPRKDCFFFTERNKET